jgi:hypothetical protein
MWQMVFSSHRKGARLGQTNARWVGLKYADLDDDKVIDADDQTWIIDPVPAFSYGLKCVANLKGFDFNMFWQGVADQDVYNNSEVPDRFLEHYRCRIQQRQPYARCLDYGQYRFDDTCSDHQQHR